MSVLALLLAAPWAGELEPVLTRVVPRAIELRRELHAHPELSNRETQTAARIAQVLREAGLEVRDGVAGTGVVATLRGALPGSMVAYRADMDALPIREQTDLPYASQRTDEWEGETVGVMHACGHDVHMAVAVGAALALAETPLRENLRGSVAFIFQPAEEGLSTTESCGARRMVEEGLLEELRPAAIFGLHVDPDIEAGKASIVPGGAMAAVDRFEIEIRGVQAHGGEPHGGVDPIVAAAQVITAIQTIASRNVDPRASVAVTVGQIEAGNRYNIIPERAHLVGTIRTHDEAVQELVHARLIEIAERVSAGLGASATVTIDKKVPVTVNDVSLVAAMSPAFEASLGPENLVQALPAMAGEDFSYFAREVPGFYYFLGCGNRSRGLTAKRHTPAFQVDESCIEVGIRTSVSLLLAHQQSR